ncbi:MAG TPA: hypothetical protein VLJ11_02415 [Bryobacteraceae bacterium]|nr:hypothetical protein [Bryobacteraceae bacterium]
MTEPKPMFEKPRLILTHGEKGGVGKTTVARVMADYLRSRKTPFRAFDAEGETGQLLRFYPAETNAVDVSSAANVAPILDYLMDGTGKRLALVDLGARSGEDLRNWLYRGGALEEAADGRLGITVVYVLGGAIDSVGHLKECYSALGPDVRYIIVKNLGVASRFEVYEGSKIRGELLRAGACEITFPTLDQTVYQSVDKASIGFSDFAENEGGEFSYTQRRYCRTWLRDCYAALEGAVQFLR